MSNAPTTIHAPAQPHVAGPPAPATAYVLADFRGRFLAIASTPNHPVMTPLGSFAMTFPSSFAAAYWLGDAKRACERPAGFPSLFVEGVDSRLLDPAGELGKAIV
jgi:hypothetical protein